MKKIGLFLLAVAMVAGLAGCSKDHDADPVGTWSFGYTYTGHYTGASIGHIHGNGTIIFEGSGNSGNWSVDGDTITMNFPYRGVTVYSGTVVDNNAMAGTIVAWNGWTGTWHASKISSTP